MGNGRDHRTDAPETIKSDTNHALRELYNLQQVDPKEFKREVDQINKSTDLSFLAGGRRDVEIVGFESAYGGSHRLMMKDRNDGSIVRTNFTAEGQRLNDATSAPRVQAAGGDGDRTVPEGTVVRGPNSFDFTYPDGRKIHLDLDRNKTPMTFSQGNHTYDRQIIDGQPSHLWVDRADPRRQLLMELQYNKEDKSLTMRVGNDRGDAVGSSKFTIDGSQIDISGDERQGGTRLRAVTSPHNQYYEFPRDMRVGQQIKSFSDGQTQWTAGPDGKFADSSGRKRDDVKAFADGSFSVQEGSITTIYRPDGTYMKQISPPGTRGPATPNRTRG